MTWDWKDLNYYSFIILLLWVRFCELPHWAESIAFSRYIKSITVHLKHSPTMCLAASLYKRENIIVGCYEHKWVDKSGGAVFKPSVCTEPSKASQPRRGPPGRLDPRHQPATGQNICIKKEKGGGSDYVFSRGKGDWEWDGGGPG